VKVGHSTHILIIRLSALGDVLMTVPVINALALQYPDVRITFVSRPFVGSIFNQLPENVTFHGVNPKQYDGFSGLWRLFKELKSLNPTHIADLHDVLRTKVLRKFFVMYGYPVKHINKNRKARKEFLKSKTKEQQQTSFERYADTLVRLGFPVQIDFHKPFTLLNRQESQSGDSYANNLKVGIAPFAAHQGKIYPLEKMEEVVMLLCKAGHQVYLFGAGKKEQQLIENWTAKYENAVSVVGTLPNMAEELRLISQLNVMLTMDSGNMHLAALSGTPVVSIWGATHPLGGFLGWGCTRENVIEIPNMECRPCSIYGNKPCKWGDFRCLSQITPQHVVEKLINASNLAQS